MAQRALGESLSRTFPPLEQDHAAFSPDHRDLIEAARRAVACGGGGFPRGLWSERNVGVITGPKGSSVHYHGVHKEVVQQEGQRLNDMYAAAGIIESGANPEQRRIFVDRAGNVYIGTVSDPDTADIEASDAKVLAMTPEQRAEQMDKLESLEIKVVGQVKNGILLPPKDSDFEPPSHGMRGGCGVNTTT
jgi:hypothetical protein